MKNQAQSSQHTFVASSNKEEGKHKSEAYAKKQTGKTKNDRITKILGLVDLEQHEWSLQGSKERHGLMRGHKPILAPIDFFSTTWTKSPR